MSCIHPDALTHWHCGPLLGPTCILVSRTCALNCARRTVCNASGKTSTVKQLLIAAKVFAFVNLLFVPSISLLMFVAFLGAETWWFAFIGIPALFANLIFLLIKPVRELVWLKLGMISGMTPAR
jgi:hypothetical protein